MRVFLLVTNVAFAVWHVVDLWALGAAMSAFAAGLLTAVVALDARGHSS